MLSVGLVPGYQLRTIEPAMAFGGLPNGDPLVQEYAWIWHVTALDRTTGEVRTFVIPDKEFADPDDIVVHELTADGVVQRTTSIANGPPGGIVLGMSGGGVGFELDQTELPASK